MRWRRFLIPGVTLAAILAIYYRMGLLNSYYFRHRRILYSFFISAPNLFIITFALVMMWAASLPIAANPFLDEHLVYVAAIIWIAAAGAGRTLGLAGWWERQRVVRRFGFLR